MEVYSNSSAKNEEDADPYPQSFAVKSNFLDFIEEAFSVANINIGIRTAIFTLSI
jgi:hypothetical protein